jgi:chromosome segregation ATPase
MDLTTVADELYSLTPEAFTRTRNERAKEAKAEDRSLGNAIAKLPKPSTAAWLVNTLARHQGQELEQVLTVGAALRQAQKNLDGAEMRELNKQRRQLTAAVTNQARDLARSLGVKVSASVADQVEETLRAAMTDEGAARAVRTGQLVQTLSATGVGELDVSAAVAVPEAIGMSGRSVEQTKPTLRVVEDADDPQDTEDEAAQVREEAQRAADEAEAAAAKSTRKLEKAQQRVAKLEARSLQLQGELEEVRRRVSELEHALEGVDDELTAAEEKRERAENKQAAARDDAAAARTRLASLEQ